MVLAFLFAQLLPWVRAVTGGRVSADPSGGAGAAAGSAVTSPAVSPAAAAKTASEGQQAGAGNSASSWKGPKGGFLLVLGSANVDEALRGYLTKVTS